MSVDAAAEVEVEVSEWRCAGSCSQLPDCDATDGAGSIGARFPAAAIATADKIVATISGLAANGAFCYAFIIGWAALESPAAFTGLFTSPLIEPICEVSVCAVLRSSVPTVVAGGSALAISLSVASTSCTSGAATGIGVGVAIRVGVGFAAGSGAVAASVASAATAAFATGVDPDSADFKFGDADVAVRTGGGMGVEAPAVSADEMRTGTAAGTLTRAGAAGACGFACEFVCVVCVFCE